MKFKIVYDKPGRIRFRCGEYAFEREKETAVFLILKNCDFVNDAEVHSANGSILVYYAEGHRDDVVSVVRNIKKEDLTEETSGEFQIKQIDSDFSDRIILTVLRRFVTRAILPDPVRRIMTFIKGIGYVCKGIAALFNSGMTVEVLDGASIGTCLIQKNYSTAGTIMFLLNLSSIMEEYTHARTKAVLRESLIVNTDEVWLVQGDTDVKITMAELKTDDVVRIRAGSMIYADGDVVDGEAYINEATMTGESLPVHKKKGSSVFAGTLVEEGSVAVRVRNLSSDSRINRIVALIDESENLKAGVQSRAERLADSVVPFSFIAFGLVYLFTGNVTKAVSVLMVDYSCAIKLSAPIAVISAIKEAADRGITVKGGKYLEEFAAADTIVFDKTGTLTNAKPELAEVIAFRPYNKTEVLRIAACLEEHYPHSVARAIVNGAAERNLIHEEEHAEVEYIVAHGVATQYRGKRAIIGSRHFVEEDEHVEFSAAQSKAIEKASDNGSLIYLAIGGKLAGILVINDPPRENAAEVVKNLKNAGIERIVMLTGDSRRIAENIAETLEITDVIAEVLPEEKFAEIEKLKAEGRRVIMVGDGINDAPALAAANVSVAMNDASEIAQETADITIRHSDLNELVTVRRLSEKLMKRISDSYHFIITFNTALLAGGIFGFLAPATSAFLHNSSTLLICMKSMTALEEKKQKKFKKIIKILLTTYLIYDIILYGYFGVTESHSFL
ncbi:heavy metal translocating P-type ATPase [Ruminococcus sp. HUN007]|uniref:heavy metal translocating P-type ATPase n=1 Tax=Ruminococcus sp. HUN007 TaxID=1514668 RepID=UPI0009DCE8C3|nr:heavy metal translocating P-type ATPase [Ruminococcus sp. HUN007]